MLSGVRFWGNLFSSWVPSWRTVAPCRFSSRKRKSGTQTLTQCIPQRECQPWVLQTGIKPGPHAHKQTATPKHMVQLYMALNYLRSI